jgi:hypothetical protein
VKRGVAAFRMKASPDAICVWPQKIRLKGSTLFSKPMAA